MGAWKKGLAVASISTAGIAGYGGYRAYEFYDSLGEGELPAETPEYLNRSQSYGCFAEIPNCGEDNYFFKMESEGNRIFVPLSNIDDDLEAATVAVEDERLFTRGKDLDIRAMGRAAARNLAARGIVEGASTIPIQLVSNLFREDNPFYAKHLAKQKLTSAEKIEEKLWELELAQIWNERYATDADGDGIYEGQLFTLETYLSLVNYGRGTYGVEAAAWAYYGKPAADLTLLEAATLAGIPQSPDSYDGSDDPAKEAQQRNKLQDRRNEVLRAMARNGYISEEQLAESLAVSVDAYVLPYQKFSFGGRIDYSVARSIGAEHYMDMVIAQLREESGYTDNELAQNLRFNLPLSRQIQADVNHIVEHADYPRDGRQLAAVVLRQDGSIAAMYGGDYDETQVNLATRPTVTGSAGKIGAYLQAFESGQININGSYPVDAVDVNLYPDRPAYVWEGGDANGSDYTPRGGSNCKEDVAVPADCNIRKAIARSENDTILQITEDGGQPALERMDQLLDAFHVPSETPPSPAIVLGAREVSLLDYTTGINGMVANQGLSVPHVLIDNIYALENDIFVPKVNFRSKLPEAVQVVPAGAAEILTEGLRMPLRGFEEAYGTAQNAFGDFPTDAAGKTGTYDDNKAAWFLYSACLKYGNMTIGVMMRHPHELTSLGDGATGGRIPATVGRAIGNTLLGGNCSLN